MVQYNIEEIGKILDRNNYRVVAESLSDGSACTVSFPDNRLNVKALTHVYDKDAVYVSFLVADTNRTCDTDCPMYAQRLYTLYSLLNVCTTIDYDIALVKFMLEEKGTDIDEFFGSLNLQYLDTDDFNKEKLLRSLMADITDNGYSEEHILQADEQDILDGFLLILSIFTGDEENDEE